MSMRSILMAALLPLAACGNVGGDDDGGGIPGTGTGDARSYAASGFTQVALAGSDDVDVRVGPAFSVRAEGSSDVLDRLKIDVKGDTLTIGRRGGGLFQSGSAKVFITMPAIAGAKLAGSGDLTVDRAQGAALDAKIAGSGTMTFAQIAVDRADFAIAGSGDIDVAGEARRLGVSIAGSGSVEGKDLIAAEADVKVMGSGSVTARVKGPAKVRAMGSGDVDLGPDARCDSKDAGSGDVRCGG
jgi:hypothetical protein